jgi:copper chaperone
MSDSNYKHVYKFDVTMTCGGCSGAVTRVLKKQNLRNLSDPEDTQKRRHLILKFASSV